MLSLDKQRLKDFLDKKVTEYNVSGFISQDPIVIPHSYTDQRDIEIMGFMAATLAWGQRVTIINNCRDLHKRFQGEPFAFIVNHSEVDLKRLLGFKHRTFNEVDLLYFVSFLKHHFEASPSLEDAFSLRGTDVKKNLTAFEEYFFSLAHAPGRTRKHVATPARKSACKRLNMFLRWMVRSNKTGVDFGLWQQLRTEDLMCPLDVHVERVARKLGLLERKQRDWQAVEELTGNLRRLDAQDPVKYDFALFGLGLEGFYE